jgi:hypothetical protein
MMKTEITYKSAILIVTNLKSSEEENGAGLVITEEGETTNKSIIDFRRGKNKSIIIVFWSHFSDDASLCVYLSEDENVLFAGGGSVSAVVDTSNLEILDINYPDLFWGWEYIADHVLELGELECRLYTPDGKCIGEAPVDPPYEYKATNSSIEFSSIVVGKSNIEFSRG